MLIRLLRISQFTQLNSLEFGSNKQGDLLDAEASASRDTFVESAKNARSRAGVNS
jgi:hypothetical protein